VGDEPKPEILKFCLVCGAIVYVRNPRHTLVYCPPCKDSLAQAGRR
jgi:hypothetical protein